MQWIGRMVSCRQRVVTVNNNTSCEHRIFKNGAYGNGWRAKPRTGLEALALNNPPWRIDPPIEWSTLIGMRATRAPMCKLPYIIFDVQCLTFDVEFHIYQSSIINNIGHQSSAINHHSSTLNHQPSLTNHHNRQNLIKIKGRSILTRFTCSCSNLQNFELCNFKCSIEVHIQTIDRKSSKLQA